MFGLASPHCTAASQRRGASALTFGNLRARHQPVCGRRIYIASTQNEVLTPLISRSVCSTSRKASLASAPPCASPAASARGGDARGNPIGAGRYRSLAAVSLGKRSPGRNTPSSWMRPPLAVERRAGVAAPVIPRAHRRGRVPGAGAMVELRSRARMARLPAHLCEACGRGTACQNKSGFLAAKVPELSALETLAADWLPYDAGSRAQTFVGRGWINAP